MNILGSGVRQAARSRQSELVVMVSMAPMDTPGRPAGRPVRHPDRGHSLDDQTIGQTDRIDRGPGEAQGSCLCAARHSECDRGDKAEAGQRTTQHCHLPWFETCPGSARELADLAQAPARQGLGQPKPLARHVTPAGLQTRRASCLERRRPQPLSTEDPGFRVAA